MPLSKIKALNPRFKGGGLGTKLGFPTSGHTHNNTITLRGYKHRLEVFIDWQTPQGATAVYQFLPRKNGKFYLLQQIFITGLTGSLVKKLRLNVR